MLDYEELGYLFDRLNSLKADISTSLPSEKVSLRDKMKDVTEKIIAKEKESAEKLGKAKCSGHD